VALAQVAELHVHVGGPLRALDAHPGQVGVGAQVLVPVALVPEEVVDPGLLEGDPGVFGRVQEPADPLLGLELGLLQPLDGEPALGPGPHQLGLDRLHLPLQVAALGLRGHGQALEGGLGHDHRVPVAGGAAGDEEPAPLPLQVLFVAGQDAGPGVELQELAAELLQHVVGDHDRGLAHQPQPA